MKQHLKGRFGGQDGYWMGLAMLKGRLTAVWRDDYTIDVPIAIDLEGSVFLQHSEDSTSESETIW